MNHYSTRRADMDKKNRTTAKFREPTVRITRARAKASGPSGCFPPQKPLTNAKRAASDENQSATGVAASLQQKKRAVLKDVTNILCDTANVKCMPGKQAKRFVVKKNAKVVSAVLMDPQVQEDTKGNNAEHTAKEREHESQEITGRVNSHTSIQECGVADLMLVKQTSRMHAKLQGPSQTRGEHCKKLEVSDGVAVADIDSDRKDPQMCSLYAPDIYRHLRATEFDRRPSVNYMEILQRDITHSMRAILIDWLVEVSEEYRLVPDTLYMTVNLIDRFLSVNYIEKQRLQLLGITCMLIASKYEEISAPRVEEFCFITDNTYTREEVLKMESQVLNFLGFHFSVPTPKKFLGRFIQAAQSSSKVPSKELAFLAQYLAELTLTEYGFLKFLPSLVAASAVFLAIWTLDQSDCPWNPTLEHYTSYKPSELKPTVLELHELRLNTNESSLNAIREKYSQEKFNYVATQSPRELVPSLF